MAIYLKDTKQFTDIIIAALKHLDSFKKAKNEAVEKIISLLI